jgi:RNA polymerase sigma factor (sigma-70 family)
MYRRPYSAARGSAATEELVRKHLPLVRFIVGRLAMNFPPQLNTLNLYDAGLAGLRYAVQYCGCTPSVVFEAYARMKIREAIFDKLHESGLERKSRQKDDNPSGKLSREEFAKFAAPYIERLSGAQKEVFERCYSENLRLREIAEIFRLTELRICQIYLQAVLTIKECAKNPKNS